MIHNVKLSDQSEESDKLIELTVEIRDWDVMISHNGTLLVAVEHYQNLRAHVWDGQEEDPIFTQEYATDGQP